MSARSQVLAVNSMSNADGRNFSEDTQPRRTVKEKLADAGAARPWMSLLELVPCVANRLGDCAEVSDRCAAQ